MGVNGSRGGPRRAYYPSGPWIDGIRPYESVATEPDKPKKREKKLPPAGNPDPNNYRLLKAEEQSGYLIVMIQYPDCNNYEGAKIMVFRGLTLLELVNQKQIDPHFFPDQTTVKSPVARFVPTDEGWQMAVKFVTAMIQKEQA